MNGQQFRPAFKFFKRLNQEESYFLGSSYLRVIAGLGVVRTLPLINHHENILKPTSFLANKTSYSSAPADNKWVGIALRHEPIQTTKPQSPNNVIDFATAVKLLGKPRVQTPLTNLNSGAIVQITTPQTLLMTPAFFSTKALTKEQLKELKTRFEQALGVDAPKPSGPGSR